MKTTRRHINKTYRALLHDATLVLSIVMSAVAGIDTILTFTAPDWHIRLFVSGGIIMSVSAIWLLYTSVKHFIDCRDQIVIAKWIASYFCLLIGLLPIMLFVYFGLNWQMIATYGRMAFEIYLSFENFVLPLSLLVLVSLIYWTLTILLYKNSFNTYLCVNKKREIYG